MNHEQSIEKAKQYLEDIISFFGVNVTVEAGRNDDYIELSVPSSEANSILIGRGAETLRSLQHLVSSMLRNQDAALYRVNVDVADYRRQRADKLARQAREWIDEVRTTGNSKVVSLNAADRRIVHGVAAEYADVQTVSEGEGRDRKLIIAQASS